MTPLAFIVAIAAATVVVLIVAAISLGRQVKRTVASMVAFRRDLEPALLEIQRDAQRVVERLERLQAEQASREDEEAPSEGARVVAVDPDAPHLPG